MFVCGCPYHGHLQRLKGNVVELVHLFWLYVVSEIKFRLLALQSCLYPLNNVDWLFFFLQWCKHNNHYKMNFELWFFSLSSDVDIPLWILGNTDPETPVSHMTARTDAETAVSHMTARTDAETPVSHMTAKTGILWTTMRKLLNCDVLGLITFPEFWNNMGLKDPIAPWAKSIFFLCKSVFTCLFCFVHFFASTYLRTYFTSLWSWNTTFLAHASCMFL